MSVKTSSFDPSLIKSSGQRERGEECDGRFRGQRSEEETRRRHLESRFISFKICVNAKILSLPIREKNLN